MNTQPLSLHLPALLRAQLSAAQEAGHYASEEDLVADAVRTFLAARPDVRLAAASQLYARGIVSLGKAAELAEVDVMRFKQALRERNITRLAPETLVETEAMAQAAVRTADRPA